MIDYNNLKIIERLFSALTDIGIKAVPNKINRLEWYSTIHLYCCKITTIKKTNDRLATLNLHRRFHQPTLAPGLLELKYKYRNPSFSEVDSF